MSAKPAKSDFAAAARRLASIRANPRERRRYRRIPIAIGGRMLDAAGRELDCKTADMSPGDARLVTPEDLPIGQRVVLYLDAVGRVSGQVARSCGALEYAIIFDASVHKREKMAATLTWLINKDKLGLDDQRRLPRDGLHRAAIELENGTIIEGAVLDFSLAGVTVRSLNPPLIGSWVRIGGVYGRVARRIDGGFAVDFAPRGAGPGDLG